MHNKNSEQIVSFESLPFGGSTKHKRAIGANNLNTFRDRKDHQ